MCVQLRSIREIWAHNLEDELKVICASVEQYPYVAMDTEFPGVVAKPLVNYSRQREYQYMKLKHNVDCLFLIQLGLTLCDSAGNLPVVDGKYSVWQINFREFHPDSDTPHNPESISMLEQSGIDFDANAAYGVDVNRFGELLTVSGIVLNEDVSWLTFHSGYDFGYLLKVLIGQRLPDTEEDFFDLISLYFPNIYDMKYVVKFVDELHGGLSKLAELLDVERLGSKHQAGSDSLLTANTFFELQKRYFRPDTSLGPIAPYKNVLFGLGSDGEYAPPRIASQQQQQQPQQQQPAIAPYGSPPMQPCMPPDAMLSTPPTPAPWHAPGSAAAPPPPDATPEPA